MSSLTISDGVDSIAHKLIESHGMALTKEESDLLVHAKQWPNTWAECVSALLLQRALTKHANALNSAATASDRYAKSLVWATWALVAATSAMVAVGTVQFFR